MKNLFERLTSETPAFEKKVQLISLVLLAIAGHLTAVPGIPSASLLVVTGILVGIAFFAQFAIKDIQKVQAAPSLAEGLLSLLPDLEQQFGQVKDAICNQGVAHVQALEAIHSTLTAINEKPAAVLEAITAPATESTPPATDNTPQTTVVLKVN